MIGKTALNTTGFGVTLHNAANTPWYFSIFAGGESATPAITPDLSTGGGVWHHLAVVRSGTTLLAYTDAGTPVTNALASAPSVANTSPLYFGRNDVDAVCC